MHRLPQDQMLDGDWLPKTRTALGETAWRAAWSTGHQLSVERLTTLVANP